MGTSATLVVGLFVVALMGTFTLDRVGVTTLGELDLRLVAFPALAVAVWWWHLEPSRWDYRHTWPAAACWALALVGYLAATALWAPDGARVDRGLADLGWLGLLVVLVTVVSAPDPARARRLTLAAMYTAALGYALAGVLLDQTNVQGRTVAFGGGPNVYVRVVVLGVVAAVALAALYRRRVFLLATPLLVLAALLSGSRGGVVAAVATAAVFGALTWRRWSGRVVGRALLAAGAVLVVVWALLPGPAAELLQQRFVEQVLADDRLSGRPELIGQAWSIFAEHPVFGAGLDAFYARFGVAEDLEYPHNLVLDLAATGGVVGLAILGMFAAAAVRAARPVRALPVDRLAMLLAACFVGAASMFSGDVYDSRFLWVFAVLAVNPPATRTGAR